MKTFMQFLGISALITVVNFMLLTSIKTNITNHYVKEYLMEQRSNYTDTTAHQERLQILEQKIINNL